MNFKTMTSKIDFVPKWVRISVGILAILNILFGVMGYFDMSVLFHNGTGLDLTSTILKHASNEFAARNLAIGLGLMIVAFKGVPESIAIVVIIRALVELQTIIQTLLSGKIDAMIAMPLVFIIVELFLIKTLIGVIKKRDGQ